MRVLLVCLLFLAFVLLLGRAADYELAQAGDSTRVVTIEGTPRKVFSYGLISMGGRGAESWRYEYVKEKRKTKWLQRRLTARVLEARRLKRETALLNQLHFDPELAIRVVFGPAAGAALLVARCESHLYTGAQNGQYLGLFQMGSYARARYGHSDSALGQARAAYGYFVDAGWGPWECARIVGVS